MRKQDMYERECMRLSCKKDSSDEGKTQAVGGKDLLWRFVGA